ncbi:acyl carrier protein [Plantactinospora sp. WMMB334]|uniref:acyl carrier protein n=1 Tax=Plantactinospora sp. WMMB334 TaxID=3404119 RepID=UPI003B948BCC
MAGQPTLTRAELVAMLAELADRPADRVPERVSSMELAWLVHGVEQRYGKRLDLTDDQLVAIRTVTDAVAVLGAALTADGHG